MADTVLSTVDLDVFAGPVSLDVSVDFGNTGDRGSRIWSGPGTPDVYLVGQQLQEFDWFIDSQTSLMYQYINQLGTLEWVPVLYVSLPQKALIATTTFVSGSTTISVPLSDVTPDSGVTTNKLVIRYGISNGVNPVASSFTYALSGVHPSQDIDITINAIQYASSTWSNLTGIKDVHLFISYIG